MGLPVCLCRTCGYWSDKCECEFRDRKWDLSRPKPTEKGKDECKK